MADLTGKMILNRYRVDSLLGRGGMGDVYKVWDNQRGVFLAMKVLHADLAEDKVFLRRFKREADTLSALQHPHIVRFYGLEQDGRLTFMLMDYIEGTTLRGMIFDSETPFTAERVLQIIKPICSALHYAHQMGRIHCDIKPANIMVKPGGDVLVADFGIARMMESSTTMTMAGAGTPAYMAPEQVLGKNPSPQTDIYALGIILYEILTGGERPFTGERAKTEGSTADKMRWEQIKLKPPSLRAHNPAVSRNIENVVFKCLEKETGQRYSNAFELLQAVSSAFGSDIQDVTAAETQVSPTEMVKQNTQNNAPITPSQLPLESSRPAQIKQNIYSKKMLIGIGSAISLIAMLVVGSSIVSYQQNVHATGTAAASTATQQEQIVRTTSTALAIKNMATSTPIPFTVRPYDPKTDTDVECIECKIENLSFVTDPKLPGRYSWSLDLPVNKPVYIEFGWCADNQEILDQNWGELEYELNIDNRQIDPSIFSRVKTEKDNLSCYRYEGIIENFSEDSHSYILTRHIYKNISDGWSDFSAGDYVFEFNLNISQTYYAQSTATVQPVFNLLPQGIPSEFLKMSRFISFDQIEGSSREIVDNDYWIGDKKISSGKYTWTIDDSKTGFVSYDSFISAKDFYFQVDVRRIKDKANNSYYGVVFRDSSAGYYLFMISDNQTYGVYYYDRYNEKWHTVKDYAPSALIVPKETNQLGVSAKGDQVVLYINSEKVFAFTDDRTKVEGELGLVIDMFENNSAQFEFDNIVILTP